MSDPELDAFVTRYLAAWNEPDPGRRDTLVATLWAQDATLVNGSTEYQGLTAIQDAVTISHDAFVGQGYRFVSSTPPSAHHAGIRLTWTMIRDTTTDSAGTNFLLLNPDGLIAIDYQFLDQAPPAR
jgi:hypothetical protein